MTKICIRFLAVLFISSSVSEGGIGKGNAYFDLTPDSTLRLKGSSLELPPKQTTLKLAEVVFDGDGDAVADYTDFCPKTPAGATDVATYEDYRWGRKRLDEVGCAASGDESRIDKKRGISSLPRGNKFKCTISTPAVGFFRELLTGTKLIVVDRENLPVSLTNRDFFGSFKPDDSISEVWLATSGGTPFVLGCSGKSNSWEMHTRSNKYPYFEYLQQKAYDYTPTIEDISKLFDLDVNDTIVPIP